VIRCIEIALAIPDNEASTALATLQRLGIAAARLDRSDVYRCDVDDAAADELPETLRAFETIFNPNKHVMRVREGHVPLTGEVWIDEVASGPLALGPVRISGRRVGGVRSLERFTAWRLFAEDGSPAAADTVTAATQTLLCNPAFQKATIA
jgi:phosphoribosylformylglycinamidine (FGAM) synthase PurS component